MGKYICRCGNKVEEIKSFFTKNENIRVTVCNRCANEYGLNDENKYTIVKHDELSESQKEKPKPDA